ncbi:MAG TPA: LrgB family protein, partial [Bacillota bacterium]|nr:LrgB family protein [Bacillota bacterium]
MLNMIIAITMVTATILIYFFMVKVYRILKSPFFIPVLTTSFLLVVLLLLFDIPYQTYMIGGKYIDLLLGPAVVALAYPLYKQRGILFKNLMPILGGVTVGSVVGMLSGLLLAKAAGVEKSLILTLLPKSVTTPVAMEISRVLGGNASLAVVFVM